MFYSKSAKQFAFKANCVNAIEGHYTINTSIFSIWRKMNDFRLINPFTSLSGVYYKMRLIKQSLWSLAISQVKIYTL